MSDFTPVVYDANKQLSDEARFFLRVLSDHLNCKKTQPVDVSLDWEMIYGLSRIHQVEGIVFQQCKSFMPMEPASYFSQIYASTLFFYMNRLSMFQSIQKSFDKFDIPFFTVKGLDVAQFYPRPALRTMGDLDILVHPEDKSLAKRAMQALGYENISTNDYELKYRNDLLEFEIHDHLLYENEINSQDSLDFTALSWKYAKAIPGTRRCELDWNFHFIFLLLHMKKHFLVSGVGFRQFMDLVVVVRHCDLDWDWLEPVLDKLSLKTFMKVCFTFCRRWFDVDMPFCEELDEDLFIASTKKIFLNGVFGFQDRSNENNPDINRVRKSGKFLTALRNLFPSCADMLEAPYYSYLDGRPYLLPFGWIHRAFRSIFKGKLKRLKHLLNGSAANNQEIEERDRLLLQWGL